MKAIDYIKQDKAVIIADDFAMSEGVDSTIIELIKEKKLHGVSIFVTSDRFEKSVKDLLETEISTTRLGLHIDLTFGKAVSIEGKSAITDEKGYFNKNFIEILLLSILETKTLSRLLHREIRAQLQLIQGYIPCISHLNGHQHIHMIPSIFRELKRIVGQDKTLEIRFINESILRWQVLDLLNIKNTIKLFLLRLLGLFCKHKPKSYFVSILNTCKISKDTLLNYEVPKKYDAIEIMLHPGNGQIDKNNSSKEKKHLTLKWREIERQSTDELVRT